METWNNYMRSHYLNHKQPFKTKKAIASATVNFIFTQVVSIIDGEMGSKDAIAQIES